MLRPAANEATTSPRPRPDSIPPCGEGLGVGETPALEVLESPPPCPSPTRGAGTLWPGPRSTWRRAPLVVLAATLCASLTLLSAGASAAETWKFYMHQSA